MRSLWRLTRRAVRKLRGQLIATFLLSTLASLLLSVGLVTMNDFPRAFTDQTARLHTEDLLFYTPVEAESARIEFALRADPRIDQVEAEEVLTESGTIRYGDGELPLSLVYFDLDRPSTLGRSNLLLSSATPDGRSVNLPLLYHTGGGYNTGSDFRVRLADSTDRRFTVDGFFENAFLGTTTMQVTGLGLSHDDYLRMAGSRFAPPPTKLLRATLVEPSTLDATLSSVMAAITNDTVAATGKPPSTVALTKTMIRGEMTNTSSLLALFLMGFAVIILAIIMLMLGFLVRMAIMEDMPAIGVLKATGFTSSQIMATHIAPSLGATILGVLLGNLVGLFLLDPIAAALASQAGLRWKPQPAPVNLLISLVALSAGTFLAALAASRRVRQVQPVEALRGSQPSAVRPQWFPFHSWPHLPVDIVMGLKKSGTQTAINVAVMLVLALVSFTATFATTLGGSVLGNPDTMRAITVGQFSDVELVLKPSADRRGVQAAIRQQPGVADAVYIDFLTTTSAGRATLARITDDYSRLSNESVYAGREPRTSGEVSLGGALAKQTGLGVGDTVAVQVGATSRAYRVTGLISTVQLSGMRVDLTTDGYKRLVPDFSPTRLAVFLDQSAQSSSAEYAEKVRARFGDQAREITDSRSGITATLDTYVTLARGLGLVILGFAALTISIVILLIVATMLARDRKTLGIRKGLGFTTPDLIWQTLWAYVPALAIGLVLGALLAAQYSVPLIGSLLSSMGIMKIDVEPSLALIVGTTAGLGVLSILLIIASASRIRSVTPSELFRE